MLITATVCLLLGAVIGLKFNLKMIAHAMAFSSLIWIIVAATGTMSVGSAMLQAILAAVMLQVGYFVSLLIAVLGLTDEPEQVAASRAARAVKTFDVTGKLNKNT